MLFIAPLANVTRAHEIKDEHFVRSLEWAKAKSAVMIRYLQNRFDTIRYGTQYRDIRYKINNGDSLSVHLYILYIPSQLYVA